MVRRDVAPRFFSPETVSGFLLPAANIQTKYDAGDDARRIVFEVDKRVNDVTLPPLSIPPFVPEYKSFPPGRIAHTSFLLSSAIFPGASICGKERRKGRLAGEWDLICHNFSSLKGAFLFSFPIPSDLQPPPPPATCRLCFHFQSSSTSSSSSPGLFSSPRSWQNLLSEIESDHGRDGEDGKSAVGGRMRNGLFSPPQSVSQGRLKSGLESRLASKKSCLVWAASSGNCLQQAPREHDLGERGDNFYWGPRKFCVRLAALKILLRTQHHVECNLHHTYIFSFVSTSFCTS